MKISNRNQDLLKNEKGFSLFLTGHYKKSNTRNKDFVNIVAFSKKDIEEVYDFNKFVECIEFHEFKVFQKYEKIKDNDIFLIYQNKDMRPINKIKLIKRECLFF